MRFRNTTDKELSFKLGSEIHVVSAASLYEVPDRYAYAIALMGVPMVEAPAPAEVAVAVPVPDPVSVPAPLVAVKKSAR